jgi:hypothetical protein
MKIYFAYLLIAFALTMPVVAICQTAQDSSPPPAEPTDAMISHPVGMKGNHQDSSPVLVSELPFGYRDWKLISVAHEAGNLNDLRAILGNDIAIKAYREGTLPFPDGSAIARIAWNYVPSEENNEVFGRAQSFVAGPPTNGIQFMVKDSKKYATTGGWGFAQFHDHEPADQAVQQRCFPCHQAVAARDLVFTHYSP